MINSALLVVDFSPWTTPFLEASSAIKVIRADIFHFCILRGRSTVLGQSRHLFVIAALSPHPCPQVWWVNLLPFVICYCYCFCVNKHSKSFLSLCSISALFVCMIELTLTTCGLWGHLWPMAYGANFLNKVNVDPKGPRSGTNRMGCMGPPHIFYSIFKRNLLLYRKMCCW